MTLPSGQPAMGEPLSGRMLVRTTRPEARKKDDPMDTNGGMSNMKKDEAMDDKMDANTNGGNPGNDQDGNKYGDNRISDERDGR
ncbi:hypothetical protein AK812_SmicGene22429 [Symbiodinium microadriaticum]|uniref:Uncharacterized protein n=1 Tax=Symbiodinium microadriaticum TaxID=2951 RepID=A0A1Q9DJT9_SYMMI|nr:hypothetical protein AK812_SmicGene22429 [Symbiodinium microadriaticum]